MSDKKSTNHKSVNHDSDKLEAAIQELTEALQRERADSVNLRRQHEIELSSIRRTNLAAIVKELLPSIDSLERSLKHVPSELVDTDYIKGVKAVIKQFDKSLAALGIEKIKTVGQDFDPRFHEALHLDDSNGGTREVVSEELQPGYMVNGEVVRHALVNVKLEN